MNNIYLFQDGIKFENLTKHQFYKQLDEIRARYGVNYVYYFNQRYTQDLYHIILHPSLVLFGSRECTRCNRKY